MDISPTLKAEAARRVSTHIDLISSVESHYDDVSKFPLKRDDIIIASFLKSGTTLTQQILYQLMVATGRVESDPTGEKFDDISSVVPFIEYRTATGCLQPANDYDPKVWKTHSDALAFQNFDASQARILYCVRDGLKVAPSFVDFTIDWIAQNDPIHGEQLREEFYQQFFLSWFLRLERDERGQFRRDERRLGWWFAHVQSWLHAKNDNILFLIYEDVVADLPNAVRTIARFVDIDVTNEQVDWVVRKCDRETMARDSRFQDTLVSRVMGWDSTNSMRVKSAHAKGFKQVALWETSVDVFWTMFREAFGVASYEELVGMLRKRNESKLRKVALLDRPSCKASQLV